MNPVEIVERLAAVRRRDIVTETFTEGWVCVLCDTIVNEPLVTAHASTCPWRQAREYVAARTATP